MRLITKSITISLYNERGANIGDVLRLSQSAVPLYQHSVVILEAVLPRSIMSRSSSLRYSHILDRQEKYTALI